MQKNRILGLIAIMVAIGVNALANIVPFNGMNTGQVADQYPIYFFPAGYVFSIWTVIYIGTFIYAVYQLLPQQRSNKRFDSVSVWFTISSVCNGLWIIAWHYGYLGISVLLMIGLLFSLIKVYLTLGIGRFTVSRTEWLCSRLPFQIYLGWISVATIANISVALYVWQWTPLGLPGTTWAAIMIVAASLLAVVMQFRFRDSAFVLVVIWALLGIVVRYPNESTIILTAGAAASLLLGTLITLLSLEWGHQLVPLQKPRRP